MIDDGNSLGYIYTLSDPRDGSVRYVGSTRDPKQRLNLHQYDSPNSDLAAWKEKLADKGFDPVMTLVCVASEKKLKRVEAEHIQRLSDEWDLLNKKMPAPPEARSIDAVEEDVPERGSEYVVNSRNVDDMIAYAFSLGEIAAQSRSALRAVKEADEDYPTAEKYLKKIMDRIMEEIEDISHD